MADIKKLLKTRINGERLFHAYIVTGPSRAQLDEASRYIAAAAVCSHPGDAPCGKCPNCVKAEKSIHPDIITVEREKDAKELTVDVMRGVRSSSFVMPNEASKSVYIIKEADTMNAAAQNAMLKVFEEPASHAVFVLEAENPLKLLSTVRSRCELITLMPERDGSVSPEAQELFSSYSGGRGAAFLEGLYAMEKLDRNELAVRISQLRRLCVSAMKDGDRSPRIDALIGALDTADKYTSVNVNSGYITGLIMAAYTAE